MLYLFLENETSTKFTETEEIAQIHRKIFLSRTLKRLTKNATTTLAACSLLHAREHNDPTMSSTNSSLCFSYNLDLTPFTQSNLQFKKTIHGFADATCCICLFVCVCITRFTHSLRKGWNGTKRWNCMASHCIHSFLLLPCLLLNSCSTVYSFNKGSRDAVAYRIVYLWYSSFHLLVLSSFPLHSTSQKKQGDEKRFVEFCYWIRSG